MEPSTGEKGNGSGDFSTGASVVPLSRHSHLFHGDEFPSTRRSGGTRLSNYRNSRGFIAANNLLTRFIRSDRQIFAQLKSRFFPETVKSIWTLVISFKFYFICSHPDLRDLKKKKKNYKFARSKSKHRGRDDEIFNWQIIY